MKEVEFQGDFNTSEDPGALKAYKLSVRRKVMRNWMISLDKIKDAQDFPGGPLIKNPPWQCFRDTVSIPGQN